MKTRFVSYITLLSILCVWGCNKQPSIKVDTTKAEALSAAASSEVANNDEVEAAPSDVVKAVVDVEMSKEFIEKMRLAYQDYENIEDIAKQTIHLSDDGIAPEDYKSPTEIADGIFARIRELDAKVPELIRNGLDVNIRDKKGNTLLFYTYSDESVSALIKAGCDVNAKNKYGETAIFYGKGEFNHNYKMLVEAGLDINPKNMHDNVLEERAFYPSYVDGIYEEWYDLFNYDTLELLIEAGADINAKGSNGETLLTVYRDYTNEYYDGFEDYDSFGRKIAEFCIEHGANVNVADCDGMTPLMLFDRSVNCHSDIIKELIKAGADVNAKSKAGKTPLMYPKDADSVRALIAAGADVNAKDNEGKSVLSYYQNEDEIIQLLKEAGAKE